MKANENRRGLHVHQVPLPTHAAATATEDFVAFVAPHDCTIKEVKHIPDDAITGADTNTTHLNLVNKGSDGTGTDEIAAVDYVDGEDASANVANALTVDTDYDDVDEDEVVVLQYEKVGNGLLIPTGFLVIEYEGR